MFASLSTFAATHAALLGIVGGVLTLLGTAASDLTAENYSGAAKAVAAAVGVVAAYLRSQNAPQEEGPVTLPLPPASGASPTNRAG